MQVDTYKWIKYGITETYLITLCIQHIYIPMYVCMYKGRAIHGPCTATHSGLSNIYIPMYIVKFLGTIKLSYSYSLQNTER
jgi:hypothetical protein